MHTVVRRRVRLHSLTCLRERRVNGVELVRLMSSAGGRCSRRVAGRRGRGVALGYRTLAVCGRCGRGRNGCRVGGVRCRHRVGCGLYLGRARLLLENGVVAKTLAFAFLAVSAHGMGFVALLGGGREVSGMRAQTEVVELRLERSRFEVARLDRDHGARASRDTSCLPMACD